MMSFVVYYMTELKSEVFSPVFMWLVKGLYLVWPNYTLLSLQEFVTMPSIGTIAPQQLLSGTAMTVVYIVLLLTL